MYVCMYVCMYARTYVSACVCVPTSRYVNVVRVCTNAVHVCMDATTGVVPTSRYVT